MKISFLLAFALFCEFSPISYSSPVVGEKRPLPKDSSSSKKVIIRPDLTDPTPDDVAVSNPLQLENNEKHYHSQQVSGLKSQERDDSFVETGDLEESDAKQNVFELLGVLSDSDETIDVFQDTLEEYMALINIDDPISLKKDMTNLAQLLDTISDRKENQNLVRVMYTKTFMDSEYYNQLSEQFQKRLVLKVAKFMISEPWQYVFEDLWQMYLRAKKLNLETVQKELSYQVFLSDHLLEEFELDGPSLTSEMAGELLKDVYDASVRKRNLIPLQNCFESLELYHPERIRLIKKLYNIWSVIFAKGDFKRVLTNLKELEQENDRGIIEPELARIHEYYSTAGSTSRAMESLNLFTDSYGFRHAAQNSILYSKGDLLDAALKSLDRDEPEATVKILRYLLYPNSLRQNYQNIVEADVEKLKSLLEKAIEKKKPTIINILYFNEFKKPQSFNKLSQQVKLETLLQLSFFTASVQDLNFISHMFQLSQGLPMPVYFNHNLLLTRMAIDTNNVQVNARLNRQGQQKIVQKMLANVLEVCLASEDLVIPRIESLKAKAEQLVSAGLLSLDSVKILETWLGVLRHEHGTVTRLTAELEPHLEKDFVQRNLAKMTYVTGASKSEFDALARMIPRLQRIPIEEILSHLPTFRSIRP